MFENLEIIQKAFDINKNNIKFWTCQVRFKIPVKIYIILKFNQLHSV